jgi:serine/threonine protein kinase
MDVWGLGCVMFEVLALFPLFPGSSEADQIDRIHRVRRRGAGRQAGAAPAAGSAAGARRVPLCAGGGSAWLTPHTPPHLPLLHSLPPPQVLGTPEPALLDKFKKHASSHVDFYFPQVRAGAAGGRVGGATHSVAAALCGPGLPPWPSQQRHALPPTPPRRSTSATRWAWPSWRRTCRPTL